MSKIVKPLLIIAAIAVIAIPGAGAFISGAIVAGLGGTFAAAGIAAIVAPIIVAGIAVAGLSAGQSLLKGAPKTPPSTLARLNPSFVPTAFRKIVFGGPTAMASDIRYVEPSGTDQEFFDYIIAVASHAVESIDAIWFEDRVAWTVSGGVDAFYTGYLTIAVRLEGTAANAIAINGGVRWTSSCRLTGCAYVHVRIKRTGPAKAKATAPLAGGLPGRVTIIGKGAKLYDPRRDSTAGGSGSHRANDQTTWQWSASGTDLGVNTELQKLWFLLGWKVGGKLMVGKGMPPARLDLASFATGANLCDEAVLLLGGGSQRRYETHGVFSEGDQTLTVLDALCLANNSSMNDTNGRLGSEVAHNDLTGAIPLFTDDDLLGEFGWDPSPPLHETINIVRGHYTDPSSSSLFQPKDFPEVRITSPDGIDRSAPLELALIQDPARAQRLAKQMLQRVQYPGIFSNVFGVRALGIRRGQVIRLTFAPLNFVEKLFRVQSQTISPLSAAVTMTLREEHASVYAWDRDERAGIVVQPPVIYDARKNPLVIGEGSHIGVDNGATRNTPRGVYAAATAYVRGDQAIFSGSTYQLIVDDSTGNAPPDAARWILVAAAGSGEPGDPGADGYGVIVTNEATLVATASDGSGGSYTNAGGTMKVLRGTTALSPVFSIPAKTPASAWITINAAGVYTVSDPGADLATATLRATVAGFDFDRTYTLVRAKQGLNGPILTLTADTQGFVYLDGIAAPAAQTITLTATLSGVSGTPAFAATGGAVLTGSGNSRTLTIANFGGNRQVTVTATLGALTDRMTIVRLDKSTAEGGATLTTTGDEANRNPSFEIVNAAGAPIGWLKDGYGGTFGQIDYAAAATRGRYMGHLIGKEAVLSEQFVMSPGETTWLRMRFGVHVGPLGTQAAGDVPSLFYGIRFYSPSGGAAISEYVVVNGTLATAAFYEFAGSTVAPAGTGFAALIFYQDLDKPAQTLSQTFIDYFEASRREPGATVGATPAQVTAIAAALTAAGNAQTTADGKIDTFYQTTAPVGTIGDLWFDTDDGNKQYRHSGSAWLLAQDTAIGTAISAAAGAQGTADGKVTTFVGEAAPSATAIGDLWFKASTGELRRAAAAGAASWGAPLADVTALSVPSLTVPPSTTVNADVGGAVLEGQLPRPLIATRKRGDVDVSASTTWSVAVSNCTATIDASGNVSLTACTGSGYVDVTSLRDGVTLIGRIAVTKSNAPAAIVPPSGGGTATRSPPSSVSSASYGSGDSAELTVTAGSGGSVACSAPLGYAVSHSAPAGGFGLTGVWQWRAAGGTWADIAAEVGQSEMSIVTFQGGSSYEASDGALSVNQTKTGLTAGTAYGFRLRLRNTTGTASRSRFPYNTISAVAS